MRLVVVENSDNSVSCLPMYEPLSFYQDRYNVIVVVKRLWNPYHVNIIKRYFKKKRG